MVYTDNHGNSLLKKYKIDVPTRVLNFDIKSHQFPKFSQAKMHTMSLQEQPFCHLDHDVFLFKEQKDYDNCDIVTQHIETGAMFYSCYYLGYNTMTSQNILLPPEFYRCASYDDYAGYNCGYIDVKNLDVCKEWCKIGVNLSKEYSPIRRSDNCIPEQFCLYALAKYRNYNVKTLFIDPVFNQQESEVAGYTHLMNAKQANYGYITERLIERVKTLNPLFLESASESERTALFKSIEYKERTLNRGRYNIFSIINSSSDVKIRNIFIK